MKIFSAMTLFLGAFGCMNAAEQPAVVAPGRPPARVVEFKSTPQGKLNLKFYLPAGWTEQDRRPAMIFWCGGAFRTGRSPQFLSQAEYFSTRGIVAVCAEYRGTKTDGTTVNEAWEDARSAMRWLKQHARETGVDPDKIIAAGGSAGGSLAMLLMNAIGPDAAGEDVHISLRPAALVLFNPAMGEPILKEIGRGGLEQEAFNRAVLVVCSPASMQPPSIFLYGEKDADYLRLAREFRGRARAQERRCDLHVAPGAGHGFFNKQPWHDAAVLAADRFLTDLGYLAGPPAIQEHTAARLKPD